MHSSNFCQLIHFSHFALCTMDNKILMAYSTPTHNCVAVTSCLSAWIFKEYVLFGYGCTPTQEGYQKARISGLLLGPSELEYLKTICENQELEKVFKLSEDGRAKRIISFPKNPERPEVQIQISFHPMYGKRIIFKSEKRFACMYYRRFLDFVKLLDINYCDLSAPFMHLENVE